MKKRKFPASYRLLGLLTFGPPGYQLHKTAEATLGAFRQEGFSQVYASLEVFEAQGLAVAMEAGSRRKRVYTLTDQGRQVFQQWLERPVAVHDFRRLLAPEVLRQHLKDYGRLQEEGRHHLEALGRSLELSQSEEPDLPFWLATVEHGACLGQALETWSRQTANTLVP